MLASEDLGKDVPSVDNLLKKQQLIEADVAAHEERVQELTKQADTLLANAKTSDALDPATVELKKNEINNR